MTDVFGPIAIVVLSCLLLDDDVSFNCCNYIIFHVANSLLLTGCIRIPA